MATTPRKATVQILRNHQSSRNLSKIDRRKPRTPKAQVPQVRLQARRLENEEARQVAEVEEEGEAKARIDQREGRLRQSCPRMPKAKELAELDEVEVQAGAEGEGEEEDLALRELHDLRQPLSQRHLRESTDKLISHTCLSFRSCIERRR
jgi:hypothetical protein